MTSIEPSTNPAAQGTAAAEIKVAFNQQLIDNGVVDAAAAVFALAWIGGKEGGGCVALRPLGKNECEMKRLYVRPGFRRQDVGKLLAEGIVKEARALGYRTMKLDPLPSMRAAIWLYELLGFVRCAPYYETPLPEIIYMELTLWTKTHFQIIFKSD